MTVLAMDEGVDHDNCANHAVLFYFRNGGFTDQLCALLPLIAAGLRNAQKRTKASIVVIGKNRDIPAGRPRDWECPVTPTLAIRGSALAISIRSELADVCDCPDLRLNG